MAGVLLTVTLVSCGAAGGESRTTEAAYPPCSSFAGKRMTAAAFTQCTVDAATADQLDTPVGEYSLPATGRTLCEDNRVLIWNSLGWGYEGEPFHAFNSTTVELVAPEADRQLCATEP